MAASPSTLDSAAPPWHLVHFDVNCARCGHDLRGQSDPVCTACKLEFSWTQAVPLEHLTCAKCNYHLYGLSDSRCPECGHAVDWNEALLRYRRCEKPLFEYRWRDRPIRSFFRTWLLALRPNRLWQTIDIHDPPMVGPLVVSLSLYAIAAGFLVPVGLGVMNWVWLRARAPWARPTLTELPGYLLPNFGVFFTYAHAMTLMLHGLFTFGALMIFQQSMAMCKVRPGHVFRVAILATAVFFLFAALSVLGWDYLDRFSHTFSEWTGSLLYTVWWLVVRDFLWLFPVAMFSSYAIGVAYRKYLKFPHSIGVGIVSQAIALLAVASAYCLLRQILSR